MDILITTHRKTKWQLLFRSKEYRCKVLLHIYKDTPGLGEVELGDFISNILEQISTKACNEIKVVFDRNTLIQRLWDSVIHKIKNHIKTGLNFEGLLQQTDAFLEEADSHISKYKRFLFSEGYPMPLKLEAWERVVQHRKTGVEEAMLYGTMYNVLRAYNICTKEESGAGSTFTRTGLQLAGFYTLGTLLRENSEVRKKKNALQTQCDELVVSIDSFMSKAGILKQNMVYNTCQKKIMEMISALHELANTPVGTLKPKKETDGKRKWRNHKPFTFEIVEDELVFSNLQYFMQILTNEDKPFRHISTYPLRYLTQEAHTKKYYTKLMCLVVNILRDQEYTSKESKFRLSDFGLLANKEANTNENIKRLLKESLELREKGWVSFENGVCIYTPNPKKPSPEFTPSAL